MSKNETNENNMGKGFFNKLSNGDFGLAKTFWLYYMLVSVVFNILAKIIVEPIFLIIISITFLAYAVTAMIGIWKSANKYEGSKFWSVLAKIMIVIHSIIGIISILIAFFV